MSDSGAMRKLVCIALAAAVGACGVAAPPTMEANAAAEFLRRYAGGSQASDVCTAEGRMQLRAAVRAHGAALQADGVTWPDIPTHEHEAVLDAVEVSVIVSFAAGFIEPSDLQQDARRTAQRMALANLAGVLRFRDAVRVACAEVVTLQQAAARYIAEMNRYEEIVRRARGRGGQEAVDRIRRQHRRVDDARNAMQAAGEAVEAIVERGRNER